jgi:excinuclease UvrABC nuclease subunit
MKRPKIIVNGCQFESSPMGPPPCPGVYFVSIFSPLTLKRLVAYIGSSKNIRDRVNTKNHPYITLYKRFGETFWVITECYLTNNYKELEKHAIKQIRPVLNLIHNG